MERKDFNKVFRKASGFQRAYDRALASGNEQRARRNIQRTDSVFYNAGLELVGGYSQGGQDE